MRSEMTKISEDQKGLAKYLRQVIPGSPKVVRHHDANQHSSIDVFTSTTTVGELPAAAHATLGLSEHPTGLSVDGKPLNVEFVCASFADDDVASLVVATCAFNAINSGWGVRPGVVHPGVMEMYLPLGRLEHVLLTDPFTWALETQSLPSKTVAWVQLLPISEAELGYMERHGETEFLRLLEQANIQPLDFSRKSAV